MAGLHHGRLVLPAARTAKNKLSQRQHTTLQLDSAPRLRGRQRDGVGCSTGFIPPLMRRPYLFNAALKRHFTVSRYLILLIISPAAKNMPFPHAGTLRLSAASTRMAATWRRKRGGWRSRSICISLQQGEYHRRGTAATRLATRTRHAPRSR